MKEERSTSTANRRQVWRGKSAVLILRTEVTENTFDERLSFVRSLDVCSSEVSPERYWRDQDRSRQDEGRTMPNATLSPPE